MEFYRVQILRLVIKSLSHVAWGLLCHHVVSRAAPIIEFSKFIVPVREQLNMTFG